MHALGTGVDQAVQMLGYAYTDAGQLASATSYSSTAAGAANVVNQDADTYDGFGQLAGEQQADAGAVTTATPAVGYAYDAANGDRLTGIVYPDGRTLAYGYGSTATLAYEANGNTLVDQTGQQYVYDTWNRLVAVAGAKVNARYSQLELTVGSSPIY